LQKVITRRDKKEEALQMPSARGKHPLALNKENLMGSRHRAFERPVIAVQVIV
jgi:hypothetical protein